jgi:hypothetical protein
VVLIYRPPTIFVFVIVVGTLAATEATPDIVRVVVVRKTQWLHWFTARHESSHRMFSNALSSAQFSDFARCTSRAS